MVLFALAVLGIFALVRMPVSLLPNIRVPVLTVLTRYEGASAREIEAGITRPLEEVLSGVPGVEKISSLSLDERSLITLTFHFKKDIHQAALDVRDKIDLVRNALPQDTEKPLVFKTDPAGRPILTWFFTPTGIALPKLREYLEDHLKNEIERSPGVARCVLRGGREREISVQADPSRLYAYGLSLKDLHEKILAGNATVPAGSMDQGNLTTLIKLKGEFQTLDDLRGLVVGRNAQRAPIRLEDVALIQESFRDPESSVFMGGREGVLLEIYKEPDQNTVRVAAEVRKKMSALASRDGKRHFETELLVDDSALIRNTILDLVLSGALGGLIAILVLIFFLRHAVYPLLIGLSLPASLFFAFVALYLYGTSLNTLTLGGLAIAAGLILDNAIVVLDSIFERQEAGQSGEKAALLGARRVSLSVYGSTFAILIVFVPLLFVQGLLGEFFKDLAAAIIFSLLASIAVSLSLIPVLVTRKKIEPLLAVRESAHPFFALSKTWFQAIEHRYRLTLTWTLANRKRVLWSYPILILLSLLLWRLLPVSLLPESASSRISVEVNHPRGTSLAATEKKTAEIALQIQSIPGLSGRLEKILVQNGVEPNEIGPGIESRGSHQSRLTLFISGGGKKWIPELLALATPPGTSLRAAFEKNESVSWLDSGEGQAVEIHHSREEKLFEAEKLLVSALLTNRIHPIKVRYLHSDREDSRDNLELRLDRDRMASLGLATREVADALKTAVGGESAGALHLPNKEVPIRLRLDPAAVKQDLGGIRISTADRPPMPISLFSEEKTRREIVHIRRKNQSRLLLVHLDDPGLKGDVFRKILSGIAPAIEEKTGVVIREGGEREKTDRELGELFLAFLLSILFIYMLLASQMASFKAPLIIMVAIPLIFLGIGLALLATGHGLNLFSGLGMILLSGTVVREGALLFERYKELETAPESKNVRSKNRHSPTPIAVLSNTDLVDASASRLRPILATAITAILGMAPIALGIGEGAELQASLAVTVIGGLLVSTLLTLFYLPALFASTFQKSP